MQVAKLRIAEGSGLVPAGAYFKRLAGQLEQANAVAAVRREQLDAEDRELEALYRRASASRSNTYAEAAFA